jgi:hypothetical protein
MEPLVRTLEAAVILVLLAMCRNPFVRWQTSSMPVDFAENKGHGRSVQGLNMVKIAKNTMFFARCLIYPIFQVFLVRSTRD